MSLDAVTLRRLWPRAPQPIVDAIASRSAIVFPKYGLTTPLRQAHFLAQISHEFGGGTIGRESLNYSTAARIAAVWPRRFTPATAAPYVHNDRGLADKVYNDRMGNRPGSDDGFDYRGGGPLQLTGRDSYRAIGAIVGLPLEERPELVTAPNYMLEIAAAEFRKLGCLPFCDRDDVEGVTYHVNGGYTGLASRKAWLAHWKAELGHEGAIAPATPAHEIPQVEIPRGSDERLPVPPTPMAEDHSAWAGVLAVFSGAATYLGQAVDALKPILADPRTIAIAVAVIGAVILYECLKRSRASHA
jgi:putative chitinase